MFDGGNGGLTIAVTAGQRAKIRVLAVDDEPENLELLARSLRRNCDVLTADSGENALEMLAEHRDIALILTDYRMPGMNGAELLATSRERYPGAKRVLLTAYADGDTVMDAVNRGGADYLIRKPFERTELIDIISRLTDESDSAKGAAADDLRAHTELAATQRTLERAQEEIARLNRELDLLSFRDGLTGLYNHKAFQERLGEELARAKRYEKPLSLLYADLDHFSRINRELGYLTGDDVLRTIGAIVRPDNTDARLRDIDIVARFGGEEIAILLPETDKIGAEQTAERVRAAILGGEFPGNRGVTVSIGVASFPEDALDAEELVQNAEMSMRAAKQAGRNRVHVYQSSDRPHGHDDDPRRSTRLTALPRERFPTYHARLEEIVHFLERDRTVACIHVDLSQLRRVENEFGVARHVELFTRAGVLLEGLRGDALRRDDVVCRSEDGDAYLCFLSPPRTASSVPFDLDQIASRVIERIETGLGKEVEDLTRARPRVIVGYARVLRNPMIRPERLISRLVGEARQAAELSRERAAQREKGLLQEVILQDQLMPVYQPIVQLESGEVFGFEALTRGPGGSTLESPTALFSVADEVDLTFELDRACFRGALRGATGLEPVHRLFLNLLPPSFYDTTFIEVEVAHALAAAALTPANVVFEITERLAIENFASFRQALARYTALGYGVAIDDVGTRHSNLETVMALRPHFIKVSDVLTRGISQSTVKREMLRSLQRIGEAIDAVIVTEGIETADDLAVLCDCGIRYGQGFFLSRPGPAFPELSAPVRRAVRALAQTTREPIPSPPTEVDDDGELREAPDVVHLAVLARARSSGEDVLAVVDGEPPHGSSPELPMSAAEPVNPVPSESTPQTEETFQRAAGRWRPFGLEDLGADAGGAPLLSSLRNGRCAPRAGGKRPRART